MSLTEQLAEKKAELAALKERIETGEKEAIDAGVAISEEIEEINSGIESASKANELLAQIGNDEHSTEEETMTDEAYKSLGDFAAKSLNFDAVKNGQRSRVSFGEKAYTDTHTAPTIYQYDKKPVNIMPEQLRVRDLLSAESISENALTYYVMGALEGSVSKVAEGAAKPQIHFPYTPKTLSLETWAAWWYESNQILSDAPFLASAIDDRGQYYFNNTIEADIIDTILKTSGVQAVTAAPSLDNILAAKNDIMADTGFAADAIVMNPADLTTFQQLKDGGDSGQYLFGGPAYAPYGNGQYANVAYMWGLPVITTANIAQGTVLVGAFKQGASVVTKAGEGQSVELFREDGDNVRYNRVTVRIEERMGLAVRVPAAFVEIGTGASSSSE